MTSQNACPAGLVPLGPCGDTPPPIERNKGTKMAIKNTKTIFHKKASKGGRPKLNKNEKKSRYVTISLTESEYEDLSKKAELSGKKISVMLREMALTGQVLVVPTINKKTAAELGKVGGLIKVLIEQVRAGQVQNISLDQLKWLNKVVQLAKDVRDAVRITK